MRMTLIRADLDTLPAYVPGPDHSRRDQAGQQRGARCRRRRPCWPRSREAAAGGNRYPDLAVIGLTDAAGRGAQGRRGPDRGRLRLGEPVPAAGAGHLPRARRRGAVRLALVRGLPDRHPDRRRHRAHGAAGRRLPARRRRDGRRRRAAHPAGDDLQPEQPDRHRGDPRRAGALPRRRARRTCWSRWTRPTTSSSPTRPPRRVRAAGHLPEPGRAAHLLQGLPAGRAAGRLRDRHARGGDRAAQGLLAVQRQLDGPGRRDRRAGRRGQPAGRLRRT